MKKILLNIVIYINNFIILLSIFYLFNGSMEMYPTIEQLEKVRITSLIVIIICLVIDAVLFKIKRKLNLKVK